MSSDGSYYAHTFITVVCPDCETPVDIGVKSTGEGFNTCPECQRGIDYSVAEGVL